MDSIRNCCEEPSQKKVSVAHDPDAPSWTRPGEPSSFSPTTKRIRNFAEPISASMPWTVKALRIPEIVFLIQEQLPRPWLLASLLVSRQWYRTGQALVWRRVHWDNTMATEQGESHPKGDPETTRSRESLLFENAYRIRSLDCMFHSQGRTSNIDSSSLLRLLVSGKAADLSSRPSEQVGLVHALEDGVLSEKRADLCPRNPHLTTFDIQHQNNMGLDPFLQDRTIPVRANQLRQLMLKGHFDLLSSIVSVPIATSTTEANDSRQGADRVQPPTFIAFKIPTLTRLEIHPLVNSAVDIHLILDSALQLEELIIHSHGHFIDSRLAVDIDDPGNLSAKGCSSSQQIHGKLRSLKIQYLKISRQELQQIADRCPNVTEFQSLCTPGALWKQRPLSLQQQPALVGTAIEVASPNSTMTSNTVNTEQLSIVCSLARSWPKLERMHVGQQQGGFHLDSIRETLCEFPQLNSIGIPAWDCTKVTMDAIKAIQIQAMSNGASSSMWSSPSSSSPSWPSSLALAMTSRLAPARFLTSLCIMNVCSTEKVSQALHDYLCWTPHLKEFYAYNTTLYVDQMNNQQDFTSMITTATTTTTAASSPLIAPSGTIESSPSQVPLNENQGTERKRWACIGLERLVVRFARLPWRNLSEPPKRCKEAFRFLERLQNLKHLCIKEGLMLEAGREYEALAGLGGLEEVVFTTCYPIPIKVADMKAWMAVGDATGAAASSSVLKKVVVRRQKANTVTDKELSNWFKASRPDLAFGFELTDCCEEEYSFHQG